MNADTPNPDRAEVRCGMCAGWGFAKAFKPTGSAFGRPTNPSAIGFAATMERVMLAQRSHAESPSYRRYLPVRSCWDASKAATPPRKSVDCLSMPWPMPRVLNDRACLNPSTFSSIE
jgi:hypothetical protein